MNVSSFLQQTQNPELRARDYRQLVSQYYDNVTRFYQWGWGECFHFAPLYGGESAQTAMAAQRDRLIREAGISSTSVVLDVGCGVGGPTRYIARTTGARVTGVTISPEQVRIADGLTRKQRLDGRCDVQLGDAMHMSFGDEAFDVVTMIESACHMPDKGAFFRECARVLKPGGVLAGWDWIRLDAPEQESPLVEDICKYFALPSLCTLAQIRSHLEQAGLEVVRIEDLGRSGRTDRRWWEPLERQLSGPIARLTACLSRRLGMMWQSGDLVVWGGKAGVFSPLGFFVARKRAVSPA